MLVNNAGGFVRRVALAEADDAIIDEVFQQNARSMMALGSRVIPFMRAQGGGSIINVTSQAARTGGSFGAGVYSATKGFVSTYTRALAKELVGDRIRVNAVSPGVIDTPIHDGAHAAGAAEGAGGRHPDAPARQCRRMRRRLPVSRQREPFQLRHRPDHRGQRRKRHALSGNRIEASPLARDRNLRFNVLQGDTMSRFTSTWRVLAAAAFVALFAAPTAARAQELTSGAIGRRKSPSGPTSRTPSSASRRVSPGVKVKITWYEKSALYASLKTALRAGQAPDVFYAEVDQTDYIDNNLLADLSTGINWNNVEPWAKQAWTFGKGTYGFPLEASTVEVYYNTKLMNDLGVKVPASGQFDQASSSTW